VWRIPTLPRATKEGRDAWRRETAKGEKPKGSKRKGVGNETASENRLGSLRKTN